MIGIEGKLNLDIIINKKRDKLNFFTIKYGTMDKETIKVSNELDYLINKKMQIKNISKEVGFYKILSF